MNCIRNRRKCKEGRKGTGKEGKRREKKERKGKGGKGKREGWREGKKEEEEDVGKQRNEKAEEIVQIFHSRRHGKEVKSTTCSP